MTSEAIRSALMTPMTSEAIRSALITRPFDALRLTLIGEAAGESRDGQIAVACSIRNRVAFSSAHGGAYWWGRDIASVCLARWQYSCWWETAAANTTRLYALAERLLTDALTADDAEQLRPLTDIADGIIANTIADTTFGSTHYLTTALLSTHPPSWVAHAKPCATIGHHVFFKGIA